jgi:hypothetical protein
MNGKNAWLAGHGLTSESGKPFRLFILDTLGKVFGISFSVNGFPFGSNAVARPVPDKQEGEQGSASQHHPSGTGE